MGRIWLLVNLILPWLFSWTVWHSCWMGVSRSVIDSKLNSPKLWLGYLWVGKESLTFGSDSSYDWHTCWTYIALSESMSCWVIWLILHPVSLWSALSNSAWVSAHAYLLLPYKKKTLCQIWYEAVINIINLTWWLIWVYVGIENSYSTLDNECNAGVRIFWPGLYNSVGRYWPEIRIPRTRFTKIIPHPPKRWEHRWGRKAILLWLLLENQQLHSDHK